MLRFALSPAKTLLFAGAVMACLSLAPPPSQAQPDPPAQAGRISAILGNVSFQPVGATDWAQAYPNLPLGPGDRIFTDQDSRAELQVGQTFVRIGPNSDVTLIDSTPEGLSFGIAQGSIHLHTRGLWDGQSVYVDTPSGSASLNRPGEMRVDVYPDQSAAVFTNFGGFEQITGAEGFDQPLSDGSALELIGSNPVQAQWVQPTGLDDLDRWSRQRDELIFQSASYRYVSPEIPGAYELDAAGTWMPGSPYGAIWFPNNVPYGWAPYHYGRWVNHAPWGWVWVEDEPWGYAPFHYGRWVSFNGRWGWVAGPPAAHPIWSPALVVFAGGVRFGGVGVSAWFPLGPGEPYRPWYPCSPRYIDQVNITNIVEAPRVHVETSYVNINVVNVTYVNRTTAVTAMRQEDFAAGRPARQAAVGVDVQQLNHVQPLAAPEPRPMPQASIGIPPARPVPVNVARPILINEKGLAAPAAPGARPMPPAVRPVAPVQPLPGRTVVAPPPNARPIPAANTPQSMRPAYNAPAAPPVRSIPEAAPKAPPVPAERPVPYNAPRPETRPAAEPAPPAPPRNEERPAAEPPAKPPANANKPAPPPKSDKDKNKKDQKPNQK
jgi:hypothetical protein